MEDAAPITDPVMLLMSMGFPKDRAVAALTAAGGNVEVVAGMLLGDG